MREKETQEAEEPQKREDSPQKCNRFWSGVMNNSLFELVSNWEEGKGDHDVDRETRNNKITILGKSYDTEATQSSLFDDVYSRMWVSYRTKFEPIAKAAGGPQPLGFVHSMLFTENIGSTLSNPRSLINNDTYTTDVGWGCMIRTSQTLLANAYQLLLLGRDFNFAPDKESKKHNEIIDMFRDNSTAPFSIHNFLKVAGELPLQVKPGQWFGPNAASLSIRKLYDRLREQSLPARIAVLVSESCDLYEDVILETLKDCVSPPHALLILLPVRLGIDKVNPYYYCSLFQLLDMKHSVGIAGGKPSSSFYFFGHDTKSLLYLDPHCPQVATEQDEDLYNSYHTKRFRSLPVDNMDPCMMIGLLVTDYSDYCAFREECKHRGNKILYFHSSQNFAAPPGRNSNERKPSENRRRNSEFVHVNHHEIVAGTDSTNGLPGNDALSQADDCFVDLGSELDTTFDNNAIKEDTNSTTERMEPSDSDQRDMQKGADSDGSSIVRIGSDISYSVSHDVYGVDHDT